MITWIRTFFVIPIRHFGEIVFSLHDFILLFVFRILLIVLWSLGTVSLYSFNDLSFLEDSQLELFWTLAPFIILMFIAFFSLKTLYLIDTCLFCGMIVKVVGHQWYWSYEYADTFSFSFDSYIVPNSNIRNLEVDNNLILPLIIPSRILVTSIDVIHSWTLPSWIIKIDAVPGRVNQGCLTRNVPGTFFGQCSEICGINHRFMPISVEIVSFKDFSNLVNF